METAEMNPRERLADYLRMVGAMDETIDAQALEARQYRHTPITVKPLVVGAVKTVLEVTVDLEQTGGQYANCINDFVFDLGDQLVVLPVRFERWIQPEFWIQPWLMYPYARNFLVEVDLWPRHLK